ncbi:MAG: protein phosphatase 2C domain-containing protein [Kofleriaceae bacterium]
MSADLRVWAWAGTDPGRRRDHNEDSFAADAELGVVAVCDGIGGHKGGATASRMAVQALVEAARGGPSAAARRGAPGVAGRTTQPMIAVDALPPRRRPAPPPPASPAAAALRAAAARAARDIFEAGCDDPQLAGMGTTLTAMWIRDDVAHGVHCGDSRAYHWRDGRLARLTEDHTWVAEQLRAGALRPDQVATSPHRHVITRSLGFEPTLDVDEFALPLSPGDGLLLCSDGITNYVDDAELGELTTRHGWAALPALLVDLANRRGGEDNITVVTARVGNDAR